METNQSQRKDGNVVLSFILCLFLGCFGAHKFYEGKSGLGILYLCTLGLFGIGWVVDSIRILSKLIAKIEAKLPNSNTGVCTSSFAETKVSEDNSAAPTPIFAESKVPDSDSVATTPAVAEIKSSDGDSVVAAPKIHATFNSCIIPEESSSTTTVALDITPKENQRTDDIKTETTEEAERIQRRAKYLENKREEFTQKLSEIPQVEIVLSKEKISRRPPSDMPDIKYTNITRATNINKLFPLVVIDVETTGIQIRGNDIIEVSAIKYEADFKPISCFTTLLKPRNSIPTEATAVNNITDEMVKDCPKFAEVAPAFSEYISGCNIAGHNVAFDLKFLFVCGAEFSEKVRYYDTLQLAKKTLKVYGSKKYDHHIHEYVEDEEFDVYNYKLQTLCGYYGIYYTAHRSLPDCYATGCLLKEIINDKTSST